VVHKEMLSQYIFSYCLVLKIVSYHLPLQVLKDLKLFCETLLLICLGTNLEYVCQCKRLFLKPGIGWTVVRGIERKQTDFFSFLHTDLKKKRTTRCERENLDSAF
jgi:hypothetical protein